jgi:dihydroxy-acid dehydratase
VALDNDDWQAVGHHLPLLVNLQPAGEYLGEDYHRAGGVPAVVAELMRHNLLPHPQAITANGQTIGVNCADAKIKNADVIFTVDQPMKQAAGFVNLKGNLFDSAIMKTSVISPSFSERYLSNPNDPNAFEGIAFVFDGPEDFHKRIDDESLNMDAQSILVMRGAGPIGYPGGAEVVNMRPPAYLIKKGVSELPCIGDGRQSGTSGSPSILNASPEAAAGGGLALLQTGDRIRVDMNNCSADILVSDDELQARAEKLAADGGFPSPKSQSPWQQYFREMVTPFSEGMVLRDAPDYKSIARTKGVPRDNH